MFDPKLDREPIYFKNGGKVVGGANVKRKLFVQIGAL